MPTIATYTNRIFSKAMSSICKMHVAALGFNHDGVCVMARTNKPRFSRKGGGLHAERQILAEAKRRGIVKIVICRVGKGGSILPIDPCSTCKKIADKLGVVIESIKEV
jgi:cytidine deaminase